MTQFPPELIEGAKAMYEAGNPSEFARPWTMLKPDRQEYYCQAFAAGLRAIPIGDAVITSMSVEDRTSDLESVDRGSYGRLFKAAITYLTGGGK